MRKFLASIIVMFAKIITCSLSPDRRASTKAMALDRITTTRPVITKKGRILFHVVSRATARRARIFLSDEPETLEWIDAMDDEACFWDIGANIGTFSLYAALGGKVRVLSFEPSSANYYLLNRNIELNKLSCYIEAYCIAFSQETKLDTLNMSDTMPGRSMHGFGTEVDQFGRIMRTKFSQGSVGLSIDNFASLFQPPLPTHVKIDVDGLEADILRGGRKTLSGPSLRSMIVEVEGNLESDHNREIIELMEALGFTARPKADPRHRNIVFDRPGA